MNALDRVSNTEINQLIKIYFRPFFIKEVRDAI